MKKRIARWVVLALFLILGMSFSASAAETDLPAIQSKLPIGSLSELRSYAISQAATVSGYVGVVLPSTGDNYHLIKIDSPDAKKIVSTVEAMRFSLDVPDPANRKVFADFWVYDPEGAALFRGIKQFEPEIDPKNGVYIMPAGSENLELNLVDNIKIWLPEDISGIQAVVVSQVDPYGNTTRQTGLSFGEDGWVYFPKSYVGRSILSVLIESKPVSKWIHWGKDGQRLTTESVKFGYRAQMRGVMVVQDEAIVNITIDSPLWTDGEKMVEYHATVPGKRRFEAVLTQVKGGESAIYFRVRKLGEDSYREFPADKYGGLDVELEVGVFHIIPIFRPEWYEVPGKG